MKTLVAAMALAILILGFTAYQQAGALKNQQTALDHANVAIQDLNTKLSSRSATESLELQAKCSKQAAELFKFMGLENQLAGFTSHYNQKLGKCFIATGNTSQAGKTLWTYKAVYDAFEQKQYADYAWHTVEGTHFSQVAPFMCKVTSPLGVDTRCNSDDEFERLIKSYMND